MGLKFSVQLNGSFPVARIGEYAKRIEHYGFDELYIADDLPIRPAWPLLTLAGAATSRIRIGPGLVTPQIAHPVYHAMNLLVLDELTHGRAICGIGRGAFGSMLGIEKPERPLQMLREAYQIMKHVISGRSEAFAGEYFQTTATFHLGFEPVREDIPIWIGTWGPKTATLAGKYAAGIMATCVRNPVLMSQLRDRVFNGAVASGRDPAQLEIITSPIVSIAEDPQAARETILDLLVYLMPVMTPMQYDLGITVSLMNEITSAANSGDRSKAHRLVPDVAVRAFTLTGTPGDIVSQIEEIVDAGANHVSFGPPLGPDVDRALDLIANKVLPCFRKQRQ